MDSNLQSYGAEIGIGLRRPTSPPAGGHKILEDGRVEYYWQEADDIVLPNVLLASCLLKIVLKCPFSLDELNPIVKEIGDSILFPPYTTPKIKVVHTMEDRSLSFLVFWNGIEALDAAKVATNIERAFHSKGFHY